MTVITHTADVWLPIVEFGLGALFGFGLYDLLRGRRQAGKRQ